jgi:hypothetical protein
VSGSHAVREYQWSIAWAAISRNTLACLPTGLGKTHIAAVVMYNFYRWFPQVCRALQGERHLWWVLIFHLREGAPMAAAASCNGMVLPSISCASAVKSVP